MLKLADAYWDWYSQHYGSEGVCRGQELQQLAHDLLCKIFGSWHSITKKFLKNLLRWDINKADRKRILDDCLAHMEQQNEDYKPKDPRLMQEIIWCCLRNDDYGDNVKALQLLCAQRTGPYIASKIFWYPNSVDRTLLNIHLARQEWNEAEHIISAYAKASFESYEIFGVLLYADLGKVQIRRGNVVDGEATLQKGMSVEKKYYADGWAGHWLCYEQLMDLYMRQQRWTDAEKIGLYLIQIREKDSSSFEQQHEMTQKAARVIKMCWWRVVKSNHFKFADGQEVWGVDERVYYLHALYNNKRQLAMVYVQMEQYDEAQRLLDEVMGDKLHFENPILVASKELLVTVFVESGQLDNAEERQEKIVEEMTERFGYDSEKLIPALERLADIYQKNNRLGKRHHVKLRLLRYR